MAGRKDILSERLRMLAGMVTVGSRLADVGCDHGYLSIELVRSGVCPAAIAMDVREGPLAAAGKHIGEAGLSQYITTRLSDGLGECRAGEADALVCAGMGGRLMERILRADMEKARGMRELILQPQSELPQFRLFLRENGFEIIDEDAVFEDGKYYFAMKAVYGGDCSRAVEAGTGRRESEKEDAAQDREGQEGAGTRDVESGKEDAALDRERQEGAGAGQDTEEMQRLYDLYGKILLRKKHPVLLRYLRERESYVKTLEQSLAAACSPKAERRRGEVCRELGEIQAALAYFIPSVSGE